MARSTFEDFIGLDSGASDPPSHGFGTDVEKARPQGSSGDMMVLVVSGETWNLLKKLGDAVKMNPGEVMTNALLDFARKNNIGPAPTSAGKPKLVL